MQEERQSSNKKAKTELKKPVFLVGLGNPGYEYSKTRHNAGWLVLDEVMEWLQNQGVALKNISKSSFHAEVWVTEKKDLFVIKPQTFMNLSGKAVSAIIQFYAKEQFRRIKKLATDDDASTEGEALNMIVVHDDLDLELGKWKLQKARGPKIHNGLLSIYQYLGTKKFWHCRVGVDARGGERTIPGNSYVLQRFSEEELSVLKEVANEVVTETVAELI